VRGLGYRLTVEAPLIDAGCSPEGRPLAT
jgi:hypothetical protein